MQAIMKLSRRRGLELAESGVPATGPSDVLIRVTKTGICGTDRHIYEWDDWAASRIKPPLVAGHEFVGIVEEVGEAVQSVRPGDRVTGEGHIGCGRCYSCRTGQSHICDHVDILGVDVQGCFAPHVVLCESNVWKVDAGIPDDHACLFDPLGNAMHTVRAQPVSGKQVLVLGCGTIGLMAVAIAHASGADLVIAADPVPRRRKLARTMGADVVLEEACAREVRKLTRHGGVDVLLEMSGHPGAIVEALRSVRSGGEVSLLGIPPAQVSVPWAELIVFKGLVLRGINGRRMFETWYQVESFLRRHPALVEPLITHRLRFDRFEKGIRAMQDGRACKVVLDWKDAKD